ncbi:MAG TPA: lysophospholipid acyltransferase family protein [Pseudomonadales bacterium]
MSVFTTPVLTPILRGIARVLFRLCGWRAVPDARMRAPFVFIGAPHTSNWDFVLLLGAMLILKLDIRWMGKHTLFRFPFGGVMRWLGGIPVNRSRAHNRVADIVAEFARDPDLIVCIPPEGTRKKVERWKTGFYRIAHGAGVPIMMTVIDAEQRLMRLIDVFHPTGDIDRDMPLIQQHYLGFRGLRPEHAFEFPDLRGGQHSGPGASQ